MGAGREVRDPKRGCPLRGISVGGAARVGGAALWVGSTRLRPTGLCIPVS